MLFGWLKIDIKTISPDRRIALQNEAAHKPAKLLK
jgi:hypothetical protein